MDDLAAGRRRIGIDRQSLTSSSTCPCVGQTPSMAASRLADDRTGRQREEEQTGNLCRRENRGSSFGLAGREPAGRRPQRGVSRQPVDEDRPFGRRRRIEVKSRGDRVGIVERGGGDVDFAGLMAHMDGERRAAVAAIAALAERRRGETTELPTATFEVKMMNRYRGEHNDSRSRYLLTHTAMAPTAVLRVDW